MSSPYPLDTPLPSHTPSLPCAWHEELTGTGATIRQVTLLTLPRGDRRQLRLGVSMIRYAGDESFRSPGLTFRRYFRAPDGAWRPAEAGCTLYLDELPTLDALLPEAARIIRRMAELRSL